MERYEVVAGTRANPGHVLVVFPENKNYRCGGAATACLAWFAKHTSKEAPMFFRRVTSEVR